MLVSRAESFGLVQSVFGAYFDAARVTLVVRSVISAGTDSAVDDVGFVFTLTGHDDNTPLAFFGFVCQAQPE
jgi:hypothetical protein